MHLGTSVVNAREQKRERKENRYQVSGGTIRGETLKGFERCEKTLNDISTVKWRHYWTASVCSCISFISTIYSATLCHWMQWKSLTHQQIKRIFFLNSNSLTGWCVICAARFSLTPSRQPCWRNYASHLFYSHAHALPFQVIQAEKILSQLTVAI